MSDGSWKWPIEVYRLREVVIAEAVGSMLRHRVINTLTVIGGAAHLLRRSAAGAPSASDSADHSKPIEDIVRGVASASMSLGVHFLDAPAPGAKCDVATELRELLASSALPVSVHFESDAGGFTVGLAAVELCALASCLIEVLASEAAEGAAIELSLARRAKHAVLSGEVAPAPKVESDTDRVPRRDVLYEAMGRLSVRGGGYLRGDSEHPSKLAVHLPASEANAADALGESARSGATTRH